MNIHNRSVMLFEDIDNESTARMIESLLDLDNEEHHDPITLMLNTNGGEVYAASALLDIMNYIESPVYTFGLGHVMSAGISLLVGGEKGHRVISKNTILMNHLVAIEETGGTSKQIEATSELLKNIYEQRIQFLAQNTKLTIKQIEKLFYHGSNDVYFTPQQALDWGFVDQII